MRHGGTGADLGPDDAIALLRAWLVAMDLGIDERELLTLLQDGEIGHADLYRRARRIHERKLAGAVDEIVEMTQRRRLIICRRARCGCSTRAFRRSRTPPRPRSWGARRPSSPAARATGRAWR